jgi:hypothetical protein
VTPGVGSPTRIAEISAAAAGWMNAAAITAHAPINTLYLLIFLQNTAIYRKQWPDFRPSCFLRLR